MGSVSNYQITNYSITNFPCDFAQASAAATRFPIAGCEWSNHSTQRAGVFSARFCSANLFIDEIKGSTLATDSKQ